MRLVERVEKLLVRYQSQEAHTKIRSDDYEEASRRWLALKRLLFELTDAVARVVHRREAVKLFSRSKVLNSIGRY